jgi:hypothetical protein
LPWAAGPRQELVDAQAEADLEHRRAETRDLEDKTARENRREEAEIAFLKAQTQKIDGEVAQQPQEEAEREIRIIRDWVVLLLPSLLFAIGVISGSVDSGALASSEYDLLRDQVWLLAKLAGGA